VQEAVMAVMEYGFQTMRLHSVEANINPANRTSRKLLVKNSFVQEGFFKENYYFNGKFLDSVIYSLLTPLRNL
jgi:ribosomal-protein-alanine N-acetyltransferase